MDQPVRTTLLLVSLLGSVPLTAQEPPTWLSGDWTEPARPPAKGKNKAAAEPPATLHVEMTGDSLRILENGTDGEDLRCRLDGSETSYRQTRSKVIVDYMLQCDVGARAVEVTGLFTAGGIQGFPPREFEFAKRYELGGDGTVRRRDQLWGIIPGLGRTPVADTTTSFTRTR